MTPSYSIRQTDGEPWDKLPTWFRQPGESWSDWEARRLAEIEAGAQRKLHEPMPLTSLRTGEIALAVGVGTYDCNGNPKGSGWW